MSHHDIACGHRGTQVADKCVHEVHQPVVVDGHAVLLISTPRDCGLRPVYGRMADQGIRGIPYGVRCKPCRAIQAAMPARLVALSRSMMLWTWISVVFSLMPSLRLICRFVLPA